MTKKELFQEIGDINEKYVLEAEETRRSIIHNVVFQRTLATAACLVVCVGLGITVLTFGGSSKEAASEAGSGKESNAVTGNASMKEEAAANDSAMDWYESENSYGDIFDAEEAYPESAPEQSIREPEEEKLEGAVSDSVGDKMPEIQYDVTAVKTRLAGYPDDYEALCESDAFVVVHGQVKSGFEKWEQFLLNTERGDATLDIVQFTEEGDAIITNLTYAENSYYVVVDSTRDAWGIGDYWEEKFAYCNVILKESRVVVVMSKDKVDESVLEEYHEDMGVYHLLQYEITE